MASRYTYTVTAVAGVALLSAGAWWYQTRPMAPKEATGSSAKSVPGAGSAAPRLAGVEVARVEQMRLRDDAQSVGTLRSRQSVMLRPEIAGRVREIGFSDGARVQKGQLLVQLDDTLQRAEIQQAKAQVSIAQSNYQRNQELVAQNFVAQRVLEESSANLQVAQAQLALAEARLARMRIVAPFDGTVGLRNINLGDYVKDGADLVNLEDLSRMVVDFRLPERYQNKLRVQQTVELVLDAFPDRTFSARIEALDPLLDANGRSVGVRAMLPNTGGQERVSAKSGATPERKPAEATAAKRASGSSLAQASGPLRPGMFARVTAVFGVNEAALVVPEEAIVPQGGRQYVVRVLPAPAASGEAANAQAGAASAPAQGISQRQEVKLGVRQLGRVEITQGLSLGETVVVAGQQRLQKDGTPVRIVELGKPGERDQGGATARGPGGAAAAKPPAAASSAAQP